MAPVSFPRKFECLFEPHRYKVHYGGRGGAKSWNYARALLIIGAQRPIRVLCTRELQNSIKDSVHKLLSDQIVAMGLESEYEILQNTIRGTKLATEFLFEGIKSNIGKIRSFEGVDYCWVEEADAVSDNSWNVLIPTIRKEGSEIWITFNPQLETDPTYQRFVKNPPPMAKVVEVSWRDNPWFPETLRLEMEDLKAKDYDAYLHVWEGKCKVLLEGAVYADELREVIRENRITKVQYDRLKPVDTFWDLGWADSTAIWFGQAVGMEYHIIDYLENKQKKLDWYLEELQRRGYIYGTDWLPHDARAKEKGSGRSIEEQMRLKGRLVRIVPNLSIADGINAARTIFPNVWFDENRCVGGLNALKNYCYDVIQDVSTGNGRNVMLSQKPRHDWASHGADAFRYLAIALKQPRAKRGARGGFIERAAEVLPPVFGEIVESNLGWMR